MSPYNLALKFLARRPRSEREVKDYLKKKKVPDEQIEMILSKLREQKFVNDYEFATWWIEQRTRFRPKGRRVIEIELQQKGISREIVKELRIKNHESRGSDEKELARNLIQKRIAKYKELSRQELYQKLGGFLARRGFDLDIIKICIDEVLRT